MGLIDHDPPLDQFVGHGQLVQLEQRHGGRVRVPRAGLRLDGHRGGGGRHQGALRRLSLDRGGRDEHLGLGGALGLLTWNIMS